MNAMCNWHLSSSMNECYYLLKVFIRVDQSFTLLPYFRLWEKCGQCAPWQSFTLSDGLIFVSIKIWMNDSPEASKRNSRMESADKYLQCPYCAYHTYSAYHKALIATQWVKPVQHGAAIVYIITLWCFLSESFMLWCCHATVCDSGLGLLLLATPGSKFELCSRWILSLALCLKSIFHVHVKRKETKKSTHKYGILQYDTYV